MSSVAMTQAASAIAAVNQVLENATDASMKGSAKMMQAAVQTTLASEPGKGDGIDVTG